jgi:hypothetical protein
LSNVGDTFHKSSMFGETALDEFNIEWDKWDMGMLLWKAIVDKKS